MLITFFKHAIAQQALDLLFDGVVSNFLKSSPNLGNLKPEKYFKTIQVLNGFGEITYLGCRIKGVGNDYITFTANGLYHGKWLQYDETNPDHMARIRVLDKREIVLIE